MIKHDKNLSANPEADRLWKEFDRCLDEVNVTEEQINKALDDKNIQCLSYRALAVIIGKIQVALGAIEMLQASESPDGKLRILHAKLQVLGGTIFPYLAVRLKQSPRSVLESVIDACRTPLEAAEANLGEAQTKSAEGETHPTSRPNTRRSKQADAVG